LMAIAAEAAGERSIVSGWPRRPLGASTASV
jgi:hypothetical protein